MVGYCLAYVLGSVVAGTMRSGSDIDIAVLPYAPVRLIEHS